MSVLITAEELRAALDGPRPPVVLDVRWPGPGRPGSGWTAYVEGHVPDSHWIDLANELAGPANGAGGRHPLPDPRVFETALRRVGVRTDSTIVILDGGNSLAAGRLWWLLRDAGHDRVRVLNGGFAAWVASGGEIARGTPTPPEPGNVTVRPGQLPKVDAAEILAGLRAEAGPTLWDVRAVERYRGDDEPIDPVAGHIPGARNLPTTTLQNPDGSFRAPEILRSRLARIQPGDIVYCGSGITAAQALLALAEVGKADGVRLYPGSWSDWISQDRPIEQGESA